MNYSIVFWNTLIRNLENRDVTILLETPLICIIIVSNLRSKTVKLRRCSVSGCIETTLRLHSLLKIWALEMHDFSLFLMMCLRHWEIKFSFILHISERTVLWIILNMLLVLFWILTPHQIIFYYGYGAVNLANRSSGHLRLYLREVTPLEIECFSKRVQWGWDFF